MNTLKNATFNEGFILSSQTKYGNNQYAIQIYTKLTQNKQRINKKKYYQSLQYWQRAVVEIYLHQKA